VSEEDGVEDIGYADAMAELEDILEHLESDDLDVDALAARVERASALIEVCRTRITKARVQVESVVAELEESADAGSGAGADDIEPDGGPDLRLLDDS
jgi:exodeoxyribonuclease VII small subunit